MLLKPLDRIAGVQIVGGALAMLLALWLLSAVLEEDGWLQYALFTIVLLANGLWLCRVFDRLNKRCSA